MTRNLTFGGQYRSAVTDRTTFTILWPHDGARQLEVVVDADLPEFGPLEKRVRDIASIASSHRLGWSVGRPSLHDDVRGAEHWEQWAYDLREGPKMAKRSREWTAVGRTEAECVREMARCLHEIQAGRVPR